MPKAKSVSTILSHHESQIKKFNEPLWRGPSPDGDGITYSLLCLFLSCRERFRVKVIDGYDVDTGFNAALEYGSLWHVCEEYFAADKDWEVPLSDYVKKLMNKYRFQQDDVRKWYNVCRTQFPIYIEFWRKQKDVRNRKQLLQEHSFAVNHELPSGRMVLLRGKWDSVDRIGDEGIYLQENKSKGEVDQEAILAALRSGFDLQTMIYLTSLEDELSRTGTLPGVAKKLIGKSGIRGVRYNVIRRALSGGKGSIKKSDGTAGSKCNLKFCKIKPHPQCRKCGGTGRYGGKPPETDVEFFNRLKTVIQEDALSDDQSYFFRWKVDLLPDDIEIFCKKTLDPILESLCDWWDWISANPQDPFRVCPDTGIAGGGKHWRHPYGVWSALEHGRAYEIDRYLNTKNSTGLVRVDSLYPEL